ncbi:hypothetical protein HDU93_002319, partial [Gonapodya sp. JEL0774]
MTLTSNREITFDSVPGEQTTIKATPLQYSGDQERPVMQRGKEIASVENLFGTIHDFQDEWEDVRNFEKMRIECADAICEAKGPIEEFTLHEMEYRLNMSGNRIEGLCHLLSVAIHHLPTNGALRLNLAQGWLTQFHEFAGPWVEDLIRISNRVETLRTSWASHIVEQGNARLLLFQHAGGKEGEDEWNAVLAILPEDKFDPRDLGIDPWSGKESDPTRVIWETVEILGNTRTHLMKQQALAQAAIQQTDNSSQKRVAQFMIATRTAYAWFRLGIGIFTQLHLAWLVGTDRSADNDGSTDSDSTVENRVLLFSGESEGEIPQVRVEPTCYDYHADTLAKLGVEDQLTRPILGIHATEVEGRGYEPAWMKCRNGYLRTMKLALNWPEMPHAMVNVRGLTSEQAFDVLTHYPTPWNFEVIERFIQVVDEFVAMRKSEVPGYGIEYAENFYPSYTRTEMQRRRVFRSVVFSVTHRLREYAVNQHLPFEWTDALDSAFLRTKILFAKVEDVEGKRKAKPVRPGPVESAEYAPDFVSTTSETSTDADGDSDVFDLSSATGIRPQYGRDANVRSGILRPAWVKLPSEKFRPMVVMLEFPEDCTPRSSWEYTRSLTAPEILVIPTPQNRDALLYFLRALGDFWKGGAIDVEVIEVLMMENLEPLVRLSKSEQFEWEQVHDTCFIRAKRLVRKVSELKGATATLGSRDKQLLPADEKALLENLSVHLWDATSDSESTISSVVETDQDTISDVSDTATESVYTDDTDIEDHSPSVLETTNVGIDSDGEIVLLDDEDPMDPHVRMKQLRKQIKEALTPAILSDEQKSTLEKTLWEYEEVLSVSQYDLGTCTLPDAFHRIHLMPNFGRFRHQNLPMSEPDRQILKREIDRLERVGIIRPAKDPLYLSRTR